jgi:hypothetical protein
MTGAQRLVAAALAAALVGCQLTATFTTGYEVDRVALRAQPINSSLAVKRFEEARPPRLYTLAGKLWMTCIPFIPYVTMPFERIDESVRIQSRRIGTSGRGTPFGARQDVAPDFEQYAYPASIARAIAEDLGATGLFASVVYVGDEPAAEHRYHLTGEVSASPLRVSASSYGLGPIGVYLWFLALPYEKTTASTTVDLTLTDTNTGEIVWRDSIESEISRVVTLYTGSAMVYGPGGGWSFSVVPPPSDSRVDRRSLFSWHFESLRRAMMKAKPSLAEALAGR